MPGGEDLVHVGPLELFALEEGLVVGQLDDRLVKAHPCPGEEIPLLAGARLPVPQTKELHELRQSLAPLLVVLDVGGGALLGHKPQPGPGIALPLNLAEGRPPSGAILLDCPLGAEAHQQEDHICRKPHLVVEAQQCGKVRGGELFPQLPLHGGSERGKLRPLQRPGHIRPGILHLPLRRLGDPSGGGHSRLLFHPSRLLGQGHQPLPRQDRKGPAEPVLRPAQSGTQSVLVAGSPAAEHRNIQ